MEKERKTQIIKLCIAIFILAILLGIVAILMIKYEVEGDKNMPFNLSKIVAISTAEGIETEGKNKWNFNVYQNNDIYLYIDKNTKYMGENKQIDKVVIENINVVNAPKVGQIQVYMPNSTEGRLYTYDSQYIVESKLEYKGASQSNPQTLEIGSQGGSINIRFSNTNVGNYSSDKDKQITHDGTLLNKLQLTNEDVKFTVSFDLVMEISDYKYRANITLDLPYGNISEEGTASLEKNDMTDIVFKRE